MPGGNKGTGGTMVSSSGGAAGSGGANPGTGGAVGSGGANAGTGGGNTGSGGNSGGTSGAGGGSTADSDGAAPDTLADGGTDGRPVQSLATFTTADNLQGFSINPYSDPNNLGDPARDGGAPAALTWDGTEGTPDNGALKLTASYSDFGQFVIVQQDFSEVDVRDWTGRKLHISLKIAGGFRAGGGVKVFVQNQIAGADGGAATYPYADQYHVALPGTDWQEFTFDADAATYRSAEWDATSITTVRWFGVNFDAGAAPTATDPPAVKPTPATFYIDNVWLE